MNTESSQLSFPVTNLLSDDHDIKVEKDMAESRTREEPAAAELMEEQEDDSNSSSCRVSPINQPSSSMHAALSTRDLWERFDELNTEMIVTRRGRRMFPPIKVQVQDLNPSSFYVLLMDLVPVDKYRYKYQNSQWVKCFEETCSPTRLYVHPESPALGSYWMEHNVSFYKLKLTNNQLDKQGHIIVNSMHRYQPRLHIVESSDIHNLNWEDFHTFEFPKTKFITVTAYQNDKITQLKIEYNPFAKGFRSPLSRTRMKPIKTNSETEKRANDSSSCITLPRIRSSSDTGSEGHSPVILQRNGVIFTPTKKRGPSISDDELPANKRPFMMYCDSESPDAIMAPYRSSSSYTVGISPPPPPLVSTVPKEGLMYERIIGHKSDPQYLTNQKITEPKAVHLVEVNPSGRSNGISIIPPSPTVIQGGFCKSSRSSSCSDETDDSDSDSSSTGGSSSRSISTGKLTTMLSSSEFYRKKKNAESKKPSVIHTNRQFFPVGSSAASTLPQFLQQSPLQPLITYPPSQPLYIQPSLDGRSQQILVPIATVPLSTNSTTPNKIQPAAASCGTTQGLFLQASPALVQGTNSSPTLQLATIPTQTKPQQLLHGATAGAGPTPPPGTVPIYINGHSAQILPQSSQPIQIVTLANATHVHS